MSVPYNRLGGRDGKVKLGCRRLCFRQWLYLNFVCDCHRVLPCLGGMAVNVHLCVLFFFLCPHDPYIWTNIIRILSKAETGVFRSFVLLCFLTKLCLLSCMGFGTLRKHKHGYTRIKTHIAAALHAFYVQLIFGPFLFFSPSSSVFPSCVILYSALLTG